MLENDGVTLERCRVIAENREWAKGELKRCGFTVTPSLANFIFASHPEVAGDEIYSRLREKGVLVRHFTSERIREYNRITVGSKEQMEILIKCIEEILEEVK